VWVLYHNNNEKFINMMKMLHRLALILVFFSTWSVLVLDTFQKLSY